MGGEEELVFACAAVQIFAVGQAAVSERRVYEYIVLAIRKRYELPMWKAEAQAGAQ